MLLKKPVHGPHRITVWPYAHDHREDAPSSPALSRTKAAGSATSSVVGSVGLAHRVGGSRPASVDVVVPVTLPFLLGEEHRPVRLDVAETGSAPHP